MDDDSRHLEIVRLFSEGDKLMSPLVYPLDEVTKKGPRLRFCCGSGGKGARTGGRGEREGAQVHELAKSNLMPDKHG